MMMTICGITFAISIIIAAVNFFLMFRTMGLQKPVSWDGGRVLVHIIFGLLSAISGLGLLGGFFWFLIDRYSK